MDDDFRAAIAALDHAIVPDGDLSLPFLTVLPVTGVSVSTLGDLLGNETVSMTDDRAGRIDEMQFDLSEGPCWDALTSGVPVLTEDISAGDPARWPALTEALEREGVGAIFAFPMAFGPFRLGAVDLYATSAMSLQAPLVQQTSALTAKVGRHVLRRALAAIDDDGALLDRGPLSRRVVHQATGVVLAQLDISPDDAHLLIQGHAFAARRPMRDIAEDILAGRLRFVHRGVLIEAES